ncbi:phytanoyl-CoA dioxygenase family protein [Streptomyces sp. NPDC088789]|uniref:phytanoyl-CoA dioxygenase family protein n=1 Tax=Streptomyces sp. NPDC088789 TaxID=3365899 RepID=UPI0038038566
MAELPTFRFGGRVTDAELAFYEEYGFIVYRGMVAPEEVAVLSEDADHYQRRVLAGTVASEHVDTVAPVTKDENGTPKRYHRLNYVTQYCERSRDILRAERFALLGRAFAGPSSWLLEDTMNGVVWQHKTGGTSSAYGAIRWHLDFPAGHPLSPVVTVGIYLDDSTRSNGCLAVIPKSHRYPIGVCAPEPVYLEVAVGDVICHHERIYHGSDPMPDPSGHRATIYLYFCAGAYPGHGLPFADTKRLKSVQKLFVGSGEHGMEPER